MTRINETVKIARACAVGGAVCVAVALAVAPMFWWFGLIAGFAGGYLAYEFREVLRAVPHAVALAWRGTNAGFRATGAATVRSAVATRDYFAACEHPFFFLYALTFAVWAFVVGRMLMADHLIHLPDGEEWSLTFLIANAITFGAYPALPTFGILALLAWIGCHKVERRYWEPSAHLNDDAYISGPDGQSRTVTRREELEYLGRRPSPLTYGNLARWILEGAVAIPFVAVRGLLHAAWEVVRFAGRFIRFLVLAIHSSERLLCGMDGMLGGGIVAAWAVRQPELIATHALVAIAFGGILGAAFGVLNYRLVSPRLSRYPVKF